LATSICCCFHHVFSSHIKRAIIPVLMQIC